MKGKKKKKKKKEAERRRTVLERGKRSVTTHSNGNAGGVIRVRWVDRWMQKRLSYMTHMQQQQQQQESSGRESRGKGEKRG
jgi:hypothetical protein